MNARAISIARAFLALAMVIALAPAVPCSAFAAEADSGAADARASQQPVFTLDGSSGSSGDVKPLGEEGEVTKEPTCIDEGTRTFTDPDSGISNETIIPALGHSFTSSWQTVSKTSSEIVESRQCDRCDAKQIRTTTITYNQNTSWKRIWGATAPITMQEIAKEFGKTKSAVVTTDSSYKDALAASALAGKCNGLVLMTKKGSLTPQTKAALKAAGVKNVYILGSTANVSAAVEKQLKSGTGVTKVVRIAGTTPSQRAVAAAKYGGKKSDTVIIATQNGFQDALSIAPYSYATKSPILYAETSKKLSAATVSYIKSAKYRKAIVVGGPIALPASIDTQLKKAGVTQVTRLAGANLYATSAQIADWTTGGLKNGSCGTYKGKALAYVKFQPSVRMNANKLAVSTGQNWLDALAGAALCGKNRSAVLLADTKTTKSNYKLAADWCAAHKASIKNACVLGGTSAVSKTVWDALVDSTIIAEEQVGEPVLVEKPASVVFSRAPGCYTEDSITLELSSKTAGEIRYTLDGSTPDENSTLYDGPIALRDLAGTPNIIFSPEASSKMVPISLYLAPLKPVPVSDDDPRIGDSKLLRANVVRAVCIANDGTVGPVTTGTYFVGEAMDLDALYGGVPIFSIVTDSANLIDYEQGILVRGRKFDEWFNTDDAASTLADGSKWDLIDANFSQKGKSWERPVSIEVFSDDSLDCAFNAGIRVKGGYSRVYAQKSFNIYLRKSYGQSKIDYPLIPSLTGYDGEVVSDYGSFTLRNGGNDIEFLKFKDALVQSLVADRAFSTQMTVPAVVFLNGEYAGCYGLQEKIDADFYERHYGVDDDNVVVIKENELEEGKDDDYQLYMDLRAYEGEDLSDSSKWKEFTEVMDVESMAEYYATQIYIGNYDWRQDQNTILWRSRDASCESPYADGRWYDDGRWRWSLYDTDISTGLYPWDDLKPDFNSFKRALECYEVDKMRHPLFASALRNREFRALFMEKLRDIGRTNYAFNRVSLALDEYAAQWDPNKPLMADFYKRFDSSGQWARQWYECRDRVKDFFANRYDNIISLAEEGLAEYE